MRNTSGMPGPGLTSTLLAERIEALISTENAKWISDKEQVGKAKATTVQQ